MSFEHDSLSRDVIVDEVVITDPELLAIQEELQQTVDDIHSQIDDFADSLSMADPLDEPKITQDTIDGWVEEVLGEAPDEEFVTAADSLSSVTNVPKLKRKDAEGKVFRMNPLEDGMVALHVIRGVEEFRHDYEADRGFRRMLEPHVKTVRELSEYWKSIVLNDTEPTMSEVDLTDLSAKIAMCIPILPNLELIEEDDSEDIDYRMHREEYAGTIVSASEIAGDIDLGELRLLVVNDMCREVGSKPMAKAVQSLFEDRQIKSGIELNEVDHRDAVLDVVGGLIGDLHEDGLEHFNGSIEHIRKHHTSGRMFKMSSRKFEQSIDRITKLGLLYGAIDSIESAIDKNPIFTKSVVDAYNAATMVECAYLIGAIIDKLDAINHKVLDRIVNAQHDEAGGLQDQAMAVDSLRVQAVHSILSSFEALPLDIDPELLHGFDNQTRHYVAEAVNKRVVDGQLEKLQPEVQSRIDRIREIDSLYTLSNSKMRQRDPEIMSLAKILADSVNNHDPISVDASRSLVAMMRGLHIERTGEGSSLEHQVNCYLQDADEARRLLLELEFLGHKNGSSKLLSTINLLDELIDAGIFDNTGANPELGKFDDFLIEYISAKEPTAHTESLEEVIEDSETGELVVPEIPVETIGQADFEDIKVFPPGATESEVMSDFIKVVGEDDLAVVEWERIQRLIELRDKFSDQNIEVSLMRTQHASWQVLPFFVLEAKLSENSRSVVVVESPVYGNATYVYRESDIRPEWRDVVQLSKREAREFGATALVHVDSSKLSKHFVKIWNRVISELTIHQ